MLAGRGPRATPGVLRRCGGRPRLQRRRRRGPLPLEARRSGCGWRWAEARRCGSGRGGAWSAERRAVLCCGSTASPTGGAGLRRTLWRRMSRASRRRRSGSPSTRRPKRRSCSCSRGGCSSMGATSACLASSWRSAARQTRRRRRRRRPGRRRGRWRGARRPRRRRRRRGTTAALGRSCKGRDCPKSSLRRCRPQASSICRRCLWRRRAATCTASCGARA
mmetsp:Transcript_10939/g.32110  ORF Transcript_10939/g.32110 Transcript_10939/m.32110 type:complete len:220 (-) Transcript_10939:871-1530(-)